MPTSKELKIPGFESALGMLPGLVVFMLLTNGVILNPSYTGWLTGDAFLAWQGWQFFRLSPLIQWPLGANPFFGLEISSSIVFPDSVPLMAFIFKPFSALLPTEFQYFGIFILACFLLQSLYAYKILRIYSSTILPAFFGSALFVLAPILLVRLTETYQHHALFSQWVILAALYFYLRNKFSYAAWIALQVITLLINVYLFSMVFSVFLADLVQRKYLKQITLNTISILIPTTLSFIIFIMWAAGFFMVGSPGGADGLSGGGFGFYRMNLLSPIDSNLIWSKFIPDFYTNKDEEEGFNFLGIGILSILPFALFSLFQTRTTHQTISKKNIPLLILATFCTLYAVSNQIHIASYQVVEYEIPRFIRGIFNTFSSSGRFFWIPHYLFIICIFRLIFKLKSKHIQATAILGAILIQVIDSSRATHEIKTHFINPNKTFEKLSSDLWKSLAKKYKNIIYVDPGHLQSPEILALYEFASSNKMAINLNWQSKFNATKLLQYRDKISKEILEKKFDIDSLYIYRNNELWDYSIDHLRSEDKAFRIGSFKIVAPEFNKDGPSQRVDDNSLLYIRAPGIASPTKALPFVISFTPEGNFQSYRGIGWSHPEKDGTWIDGGYGTIRIQLDSPNFIDAVLTIDGNVFVSPIHQSQSIEIYCNGLLIDRITRSATETKIREVYKVPHQLIQKNAGFLFIDFIVKNPASPKTTLNASDNRLLGLQLNSIQIQLK